MDTSQPPVLFSLFKGRLHGYRRCGLKGVTSGGVATGGVVSGGVASGGVATGLKTPEFKGHGSGVFLCFDYYHSVILWFFMV